MSRKLRFLVRFSNEFESHYDHFFSSNTTKKFSSERLKNLEIFKSPSSPGWKNPGFKIFTELWIEIYRAPIRILGMSSFLDFFYLAKNKKNDLKATSGQASGLSALFFLSQLKTYWLLSHFDFKSKIWLVFWNWKISQKSWLAFSQKHSSQKIWLAFLETKIKPK